MKKIRGQFFTGINKTIAGLLALLGFSASTCDSDFEGEPMYGTPYAHYEIKGKVITEEGEAIRNIQVIIPQANINDNYMYLSQDTLTTDSSGDFFCKKSENVANNITFKVIAKDIDGAENGGYFEETITNVSFKQEDLIGGEGTQYLGKAEKRISITMKQSHNTPRIKK